MKIVYNDDKNSTYLFGIDLDSGGLVSQITLPFVQEFFIGIGQALQVDPTTGDVFVFGEDSQHTHHLLRFYLLLKINIYEFLIESTPRRQSFQKLDQ